MIPLVVVDANKIAPLQPYGACCMIAFFAWDYVGMKLAVRRGFDRADFRVLTILIGVLGWFSAWAVNVAFYEPVANTSRFGMQGFSSTGAMVGATLAAILWSRFEFRFGKRPWSLAPRKLPLLPISEVILATWPVAFAFGRLGCSLIHDHVGRSVAPGTIGSLFAVAFPRSDSEITDHAFGPFHVLTGGSDLRYDLGLIELVVLAAMAVAFARTWNKQVKMGTYTMVSCLVYGPIRFVLDFLRADEGGTGEPRYAGLTFAQYWSLAVVALGIVLFVRRVRTTEVHTAAPAPSVTTQMD